MRTNYSFVPSHEQGLAQQRDALAGSSSADTNAFSAALAAGGSDCFAVDKRRGEQVRLYKAVSNSGNAQCVSLFSEPNQRNEVGSMSVAPRGDTLRILTIENCGRSKYKGVGTAMINLADRIRESAGLSSLSLISQDEGASEFFYKKGFRFAGEGRQEKNFEMQNHIYNRTPVLDHVILVGDMERPA